MGALGQFRIAVFCGIIVVPGIIGCAGSGSGSSSGQAPTATVAVPGTTSATGDVPATTAAPQRAGDWNVTYDSSPPHGWVKFGPEGDVLLRLSGPPGGPLGLSVRRAPPFASDAAFEAWVKEHVRRETRQEVESGMLETVKLGGADVRAYSFFTGASLARSHWCVAQFPVAGSQQGVIVSALVGAGQRAAPSCAEVTSHEWIARVWSSLKVEAKP